MRGRAVGAPSAHRPPEGRPCSHRRYLLSCEQYEELRRRANYQCEICGTAEEKELHGVLSVDHHGRLADWAVRGLLCARCNTGLFLPAIAGEGRERYYENSWYVRMLADRGLRPEPGDEPPVGSTVVERSRRWKRETEGWVCQSKNGPWGPKTWEFLFKRYGPHNVTVEPRPKAPKEKET